MPRSVRPIYPSAAIAANYEQRLARLVERMARQYDQTLTKAYRQNPTVLMAQDADPAAVLSAAMRTLGRRWSRQFDELADNLSKWFATSVTERSDRMLRNDLRRGGFTVKFTMSEPMRQAFNAVRAENVALIRSVQSQYHGQVEQMVQSSVATGRDIGALAKGLQDKLGVTRRRAALIARDQNNKATGAMQRARQLSLGITRAKWLHSAGGNAPRPEHVAFSGKTYSIRDGHDFGDGEGPTWPGVPINCKCVSVPVIPGFDD